MLLTHVIIPLVMLALVSFPRNIEPQISGQKEAVDSAMKKLQCAMIKNNVLQFGVPETARRNIWVMMEESAFSDSSLRELFALLSSRYPEPYFLSINVITSDAQRPRGYSEGREPPGYYEHHRAVYLRRPTGELFRYTVNPTDRNLRTVDIKSK